MYYIILCTFNLNQQEKKFSLIFLGKNLKKNAEKCLIDSFFFRLFFTGKQLSGKSFNAVLSNAGEIIEKYKEYNRQVKKVTYYLFKNI